MTVASEVSLIISVYNGEPFLEQALRSVFAQTRRPEQIILVDDGSTDGTAGIARSHPEVTYFRQPNRGVSSARNLGIRSATGDFIAFLDADDLWAADMLEGHCDLLERNPESQVVVGLVQPFRMKSAGAENPDMVTIGEPALLLNLGSALFRKGVFDRIGLMDEDFSIAADWDWFLRAREEGVPVLTPPETALFYRRHGANITNRKKQLEHELLILFKKTLERRRRHGIAGELPRLSDFMAEIQPKAAMSYDASE
jgi:glycosyltransferase involved in cell wall biosynthesis